MLWPLLRTPVTADANAPPPFFEPLASLISSLSAIPQEHSCLHVKYPVRIASQTWGPQPTALQEECKMIFLAEAQSKLVRSQGDTAPSWRKICGDEQASNYATAENKIEAINNVDRHEERMGI